MRWLLASCACLLLVIFARGGVAAPASTVSDAAIIGTANPPLLSAFGFFAGGADRPVAALNGYKLGTPLFSDYAEKERFIYLPQGAAMRVDREGRIAFPVGTALVKSFGYPDAAGKLRIIETRLLLHRADGWIALPYVWRADGSDADLKLGGTRVPVSFTKPDGNAMQISYAVPNKNQCKQCHASNDAIMPIGPVWQDMLFESETVKDRLSEQASFPKNGLFAAARWNDPKAALNDRAMSYLRINCGHCHKPSGSASNSGLFYDDLVSGDVALGIGKRPVAAGRGSGSFDFVIESGHPERSILLHRMKSTDPGVAMPELGRATVHDEGAALLEAWIREMKPAA
jgi:uncharacterized repeat protein (TIGR03806 family)